MDIGVLTVKDEGYHPNRRLKEAAMARGFSLALIDPRKVTAGIDKGRLRIGGLPGGQLPGVILPRQGSQISNASIVVLAHLQVAGIPMVNALASVLTAKNKFATLQVLAANGVRVPDSIFVNSDEAFFRAVETLGGYPMVCKKTSGRKGREVFLAENPISAQEIINAHLDSGGDGLILQRFIPPGNGRRDFRVMVIGGTVAAAMQMTVPEGDFRSNFGLSGSSRPAVLAEAAKETAIQCARATGLGIAGVDLIETDTNGIFAIEANYAPGFKGLEMATGLDIATMIIDFAATFLSRNKSRTG
nr:RimK family alpha-L-glutamate ligase [Desulfatitalea alkaliphila]